MSKTLPTSKNASPLVRSQSEAVFKGGHDVRVGPHDALASVSPSRNKTFTSLSSLKTVDQQTPQLSERDSIFATSYFPTESNSATPKLSSTVQSKNEPIQNVAPRLQLPPSLLSGAGGSRSVPATARASSAMTLLNRTSHLYNLDSEQPTISSPHDEQQAALIHPKVASSNKLGDSPSSRGFQFSSDILSTHRPKHPQLPRSQTVFQLRMSQWSPAQSSTPIKDGNSPHTSSPSKEVTPRNRTEMDIEHDGQDQQIEAVIASEEPAPHGRSRKASHYLGLFKENAGLQDKRTGKERAEASRHDGDTDNRFRLKADKGQDENGLLPGSVAPNDQRKNHDEDSSTAEGKETANDQQSVPPSSTRSSSQATTVPSLSSQSSSMTETDVDFVPFPGNSIEWRSGDSGHGSLPLRLLEDIRNHRGARTLRKGSHGVYKDPESKRKFVALHQGAHWAPPAKSSNIAGALSKNSTDQEDDDFESDKEHISSATYYPHQGRSPDTVAELHHFEESELHPTDPALDRLPPTQIISLEETASDVLVESGNSVFNLQSKDRIHYIEKPRQKTRKFSDGTDTQSPFWSIPTTTSETENESGYDTTRSGRDSESGFTDGGETTPTATPLLSSTFPLRKRRKPLRAVELKPYKHQVGGHTKVFSFSKQAICKQLNSRENVFYEVIERRHPELLQFLPR